MAGQHARVLISYSHDSEEYTERVLQLSNRFREHGIDSHIDQYTPVPSEGWPVWMERQIASADFVLCLCTENYHRRFADDLLPGEGRGVAWEANLIRNALYATPRSNNKFLTVQFDGYSAGDIPECLKGYTNFVLTKFEISDPEYQKLYRHLTRQPDTPMPALGNLVPLEPGKRKTDGAPDLISAREAAANSQLLPPTGDHRSATTAVDMLPGRSSPATAVESKLCQAWKRRLEIFQLAEADEVDAVRRQKIRADIEEAKNRVKEYCSDPL